MRHILIFIFLISLTIGSWSTTSVAQDEPPSNDAPYLYYYSIEHQAFVIERADGTDRRLIGDNLMPKDHNYVYGAGWSPSGNWFAWISTLADPFPNFNPNQAYIVSVDNQTQPTILNEFTNIAQMKWFPTMDLLVVIDFPNALNMQDAFEPDSSMRIALIDPVQNMIVNEYRTPIASYAGEEPTLSPEIYRTADDGIMVVLLKVFEISADEEFFIEDLVLFIRHNGQIEQRRYPSAHSPYMKIITSNDMSSTYAIQQVNNMSYIYDLFRDKQIMFIGGQKKLTPLAADYLLVTENIPCQNQQNQCPPQIQIVRMGNLQPLSLFGENTYDAQRYVYPSPSGGYVLFRDENSRFQLLTLQTGELINIPLGSIEPRQVDWDDEYWLDDEHFMIADSQYINDQAMILLFDTQQKTGDFIYAYNWTGDNMYFSPDQLQIAYSTAGWEFGATIHNIKSDTYIRVQPHSGSYYSMPGGEIYWHSSSEWLLLAEETLIAGGGAPSSRWLGVVRSDGNMPRDLSWCWLAEICYGWLPPQVNHNSLSQPLLETLPTPIKTLSGNKWVTYLSWSPDGNYLAVDYEYGELWLWNIAKEQMLTSYETLNHHWLYNPINRQPQLKWEADEKGNYLPQVSDRIEIEDWVGSGAEIMAISPDGEQLVAHLNETYGVFDRETQTLIYDENNFAYSFANYSPDGRYLVEGSWFGSTKIYDTQTWEVLATLPSRGAFSATFSPDGQYLAVGSSWDVQIWDVAILLGK